MRIRNQIFSSAALASAITLGLTSQAVAQQDWDASTKKPCATSARFSNLTPPIRPAANSPLQNTFVTCSKPRALR